MRPDTPHGGAAALLLAALAALSACTSIHVSGAQPVVSRRFGIAPVQVQPGAKEPLLITTRGAGVVATAGGLTVGFVEETVATFPDASACRTLIVVQEREQFEALQRLLADDPARLGSLCLATQEHRSTTRREK